MTDTIFGALLRARDSVPAGWRALTGLRDGCEWVDLTYDDLLRDVEVLSAHLTSLGLQRGDVVALQLPNWTEAVLYTYAASRIGAIVCPITTIHRERELAFILERTACTTLVVPAIYRGFDYAAMAAAIAPSLPHLRHVIAVGDTAADGVTTSRSLMSRTPVEIPDPADVAVHDPAILAFTSGTTGEPKGVMHSHASLHAVIDGFVGHAGLPEGLTSLVISPFGHLTGSTWGVVMPLRHCGNVVLLESWDPVKALSLIEEYGVTFTMGATPFLSDLLDHANATTPFPSVFVCGGAPIPPVLIERATRRSECRVIAVWGMSEYPVGTSTTVNDEPTLATVTDGRPATGAEIAIVDEAGHPVGIGAEGDLLVRGPGLFRGYYARPDLDRAALTDDGFLRTGDRARLLDDHGHIRISGRTKDIIIRGGENIPVMEIENLLMTHPDIQQVALVPRPHPRLGETACACLVLDPAATTEPTVADLGAFLGRHRVAKQFYPEDVRVLESLPRTPSGKIQKFALREFVNA